MSDDEYYTIRATGVRPSRSSRPSPLRAAMLFASAVIAITILTVPELSRRQDERLLQARAPIAGPVTIDPTVTGSLRRGDYTRALAPRTGAGGDEPRRGSTSYVVRRSVLTGGSVCVIARDGTRTGTC